MPSQWPNAVGLRAPGLWRGRPRLPGARVTPCPPVRASPDPPPFTCVTRTPDTLGRHLLGGACAVSDPVGWSDNSNICVQGLVMPERAAVNGKKRWSSLCSLQPTGLEMPLEFTLFTPTYRAPPVRASPDPPPFTCVTRTPDTLGRHLLGGACAVSDPVGWSDNSNICVQGLVIPERAAVNGKKRWSSLCSLQPTGLPPATAVRSRRLKNQDSIAFRVSWSERRRVAGGRGCWACGSRM